MVDIDWQLPEQEPSIIKVMGLGGGGGNAVNYMFKLGIQGVDFIICNTDNQHLLKSPIPTKIQIGYDLTAGRGVGGNPELGRKAALDNLEDIRKVIDSKTKMLFITSGMGGGTGTGAAPVIAKLARDLDLLTVGIITYPFDYEGPKRKQIADTGIEELKKYVDALIIIYNERLMEMYGELAVSKAFSFADNVCAIAAKGLAEIITIAGEMNVDFEDVKNIMKNSGTAIFGSATAEGENRASRAIEAALHSPLLKDREIRGAQHILLNISYGSQELLIDELKNITSYIRKEVGNNVDIKLGHNYDANLGNKISTTVIATSFEKETRVSEIPDEKDRVVYSLDDPSEPEEKILAEKEEIHEPQIQAPVIKKPEQMKLEFNNNENVQDESFKLRSHSYNIPQEDLDNIEDIPAYVMKNIKLADTPHSSRKEMSSSYMKKDENGKPEIKDGNAFFDDIVD